MYNPLEQKIIEAFWKKLTKRFEKIFFFLSILGNVRKTFVPREKICQQGCENCIDRNFGKNLARNEFSLKFVIFLSFPTLSDFLVGTVVKTEIYVSIRTFSEIKVNVCSLEAKRYRKGCQNRIVRNQRYAFEKKIFFWRTSTFSSFFSEHWPAKFGTTSKNFSTGR